MWDTARLEKRLGNEDAALALLTDLAQCRNAYRLCALEELAKHYEHRVRNAAMALEFTLEALRYGKSEGLLRRRVRLERRLANGRDRLENERA